MPLTEEEIAQLEARIPELSRRVFREAYQQALASGHPVTVLIGSTVMRITAEGTQEIVEQIDKIRYTRIRARPNKGQAWPGHVQ